MILVLPVALLLLASQQPINDVEEDTPFSERQPVRLTPLPAERAFAAFREICMAGLADPAAFDRAAAASPLGFVRSARAGRDVHEWSSQHGQIVLRQAEDRRGDARRDRREGRVMRQRWQARCDFWTAIDERLDGSAMAAAIGAALAPQARPVEEILGTSWDLGPAEAGGLLKLVYLPASEADPRLFTLSLQRLADNPPR